MPRSPRPELPAFLTDAMRTQALQAELEALYVDVVTELSDFDPIERARGERLLNVAADLHGFLGGDAETYAKSLVEQGRTAAEVWRDAQRHDQSYPSTQH